MFKNNCLNCVDFPENANFACPMCGRNEDKLKQSVDLWDDITDVDIVLNLDDCEDEIEYDDF